MGSAKAPGKGVMASLTIDRIEADIARRRGGVTWLLVRVCAAGDIALGAVVMLG